MLEGSDLFSVLAPPIEFGRWHSPQVAPAAPPAPRVHSSNGFLQFSSIFSESRKSKVENVPYKPAVCPVLTVMVLFRLSSRQTDAQTLVTFQEWVAD